MARVRTAKTAGFCFGVQRAVDLLEEALARGEAVSTYGPLIHNPQVIASYAARGVEVLEDLSGLRPGRTVLLRAHGVPRSIYDQLDGSAYVDATCPFVAKIQQRVETASREGKSILIAGDENHPEITGIVGHAVPGADVQVFRDSDALQDLIAAGRISVEKVYILVAQTTMKLVEWQKCVEITKKMYTNINIFDTICNATILRQNEAVQLAKQSDVMIIVGGRGSSNTVKLADLCAGYCRTVHIEEPSELAQYAFEDADRIGVTAGASTPAFIIKEVQMTMSETNNMQDELSFEEMLEQSFKTINSREKVTGVVTSVSPSELGVDIGTKHAGYVPLNEYTDDPSAKLDELVKVGDEIELMVLRVSDVDGTATLSKKRLDAILGFEKIVEAEENGEILEGVVVDVVKGGVIALTSGVRVFIPASQATMSRGQELETLKGQAVQFKILETNKQRRRAVGSIRAVLKDQRKELEEQFWKDVEVGKTYKGVVKSLTSYGAFVDLGGVDGMAHISELSWSRIKHPSEVVSVDDVVEVYIRDIDPESKKISLGYKKVEDNPWEVLRREHSTGEVARVKIVSMTPFGAFAQVIPGVDGLIHISQISNERIGKPADALSIGQEIDVKITDIDFEKKRVSLSIRALLEKEEPQAAAPKETVSEMVYEAGPDGATQYADVVPAEEPAPVPQEDALAPEAAPAEAPQEAAEAAVPEIKVPEAEAPEESAE